MRWGQGCNGVVFSVSNVDLNLKVIKYAEAEISSYRKYTMDDHLPEKG